MIPIPDRLVLKLIAGLGCVLLLALLIHDRNRWKAKTEHYAELLTGERAAHAATVANVHAAADQARQADALNAARVKSEQALINERTEDDFESRIAAARAAAGRLRPKPETGAAPRVGGAAPVPGLSAAAKGPAQGAGENRLPDADQRIARNQGALDPADALIATEQAIQLDELIKWVRSQADVKTSKD